MKSLDTPRGWATIFAVLALIFVAFAILFAQNLPRERFAFVGSIGMAWLSLGYAIWIATRREP